ncbi:hypothetical protein PFISCL1PPCAC_22202, partial [Pristionchus fissidentatus]
VVPVLLIPVSLLTSLFLKPLNASTRSKSILSNALRMLTSKSYVITVFYHSMGLMFSLSLTFWLPSLTLDSYEAFPDTFTGLSYTAVMSLIANVGFLGMVVGLPVFA